MLLGSAASQPSPGHQGPGFEDDWMPDHIHPRLVWLSNHPFPPQVQLRGARQHQVAEGVEIQHFRTRLMVAVSNCVATDSLGLRQETADMAQTGCEVLRLETAA